MFMEIKLVPLCGGVPPSRGSWGFLSSGIDGHFMPAGRQRKNSGKCGAGLAWAMAIFYLFKEGFSKVLIWK
jgi:hypothetical protein